MIHASTAALMGALAAARARIGEGSIRLTLQDDGSAYITHWAHAGSIYQNCFAIAQGSPQECMEALARYVAAYRPAPTPEQVAATIGLTPYAIAAE